MSERKKVAFYTLGCKLNFSESSIAGETLMTALPKNAPAAAGALQMKKVAFEIAAVFGSILGSEPLTAA